jgi:acyl carrier protein
MSSPIEILCVGIFRKVVGLDNVPAHADLDDRQVATSSFDAFAIDSLAAMEFIMEIEAEFGIELDEDAVNRCSSVRQVAALVSSALRA